jgi:3-methylcrotonyl-CoA carboxylase alpha subunit
VRLLPQSGRLLRYREPTGEGIRVDSGVVEGQTVTVHYDAMLAKLIAHGEDRSAALDRISNALRSYEILGLHHNIPFLRALLDRPEVRTNHVHTRFIEEHLDTLAVEPAPALRRAAAAVAAFVHLRGPVAASTTTAASAGLDPWDTLGPVRL